MPRPERPLNGDDGPVERFADGLRTLRQQAGSPGYRSLALRANYSAATLAAAASGRRLPTLSVTLAYVKACGGDRSEWEARWRTTSGQLADATRMAGDPPADAVPYRGMAAFQAADAEWYFGRQRMIDHLLRRMADHRFLAVFGPSGAGKSSLLRAGLLPAVQDGALAGGQRWPVIVMTPGSRPLAELAVHLAALVGVPAGAVLDNLAADPSSAHLLVRQALAAGTPATELLLVVDQFEEIFAGSVAAADRDRFLAAILTMCQANDSRARVVLGVRADFYARCAEYPDLVDALVDAQLLVGAMTVAELREAVTKPAERAGLVVEGALVSTIVAELTGRPGALPLASHALLEAWRRRRGRTITLAGYESTGGIDGAVAQTAETVFQALDSDQRDRARQVLLRLINIGDDGEVIGRRVARTELDPGDPRTETVLDRLADARLISLDRDTVEITHEALIRGWPRLRAWIDEDREGLRIRRRISEAATVWHSLGRDSGALYRGLPLAIANHWYGVGAANLTDLEDEFLAASRTVQRREVLAKQRRQRVVITGLSAVVVVISLLAALAAVQVSRAATQRDLALARQLTANARQQLAIDPELALLLAREAYRTRPGADTEAVLRQAVAQSRVTAVLKTSYREFHLAFSAEGQRLAERGALHNAHAWRLPDQDYLVMLPATGGAATFDRDGTAFAVVSVREWRSSEEVRVAIVDRAGTDTRTIQPSPASLISAIAFSAAGPRVAYGLADGAGLHVWQARDPDRSVLLPSPAGRPELFAKFSGNAQYVAAPTGGKLTVWNVNQPDRPVVVGTAHVPASVLALSPDGRRVVVRYQNGTVDLWDATGADGPVELRSADGPILSAVFSPDGLRMATVSTDHTVRVWDSTGHGAPLVLRGHSDFVHAVAFSPNGTRLATGDADGIVRVWDLTGQSSPTILAQGRRSPGSPALSADAQRLAAVGSDGRLRVVNTVAQHESTELFGGVANPATLMVSDDGLRLAATNDDASSGVRIWHARGDNSAVFGCDGQPNGSPFSKAWNRYGGAIPLSITMSPDGGTFASSCALYGQARLWRTDGADQPSNLPAAEPPLRFSADSRRLATQYGEGTIAIWTVGRHDSPAQLLHGHTASLTHLAFSRDGQRLAGASIDGSIRIWNLADGRPSAVLRGPPGLTDSLAFNADGRLLASVGGDGMLRIWRTDRAVEPTTLAPFGPAYRGVAFHPDGERLITTHGDGTARAWRCEACEPVARLLELAARRITRELSADERHTYLDSH